MDHRLLVSSANSKEINKGTTNADDDGKKFAAVVVSEDKRERGTPLPTTIKSKCSSILSFTDKDFPLDAIIKIVDCLSTEDTLHLSNTCKILHNKISIEWGGWECCYYNNNPPAATAAAAAAAAATTVTIVGQGACNNNNNNNNNRDNNVPVRIFHAVMGESGQRQRNILISHPRRQQLQQQRQHDGNNISNTTIICSSSSIDEQVLSLMPTTTTCTSTELLGGCHRCQKRTCPDCTVHCHYCTKTLCSKGCCEKANQIVKCCKRVSHHINTSNDNNGMIEEDIHKFCNECEIYCIDCKTYYCISCTDRINPNGASQCGMCYVKKPHGGPSARCGIHTSEWQKCRNCDTSMCYSCVYFCPQCNVIYCNNCREDLSDCQYCNFQLFGPDEAMDEYCLYNDIT
jgi:hypothetical protein